MDRNDWKDALIGIGLIIFISGFWFLSWWYIDNYIFSSDVTQNSNEITRGVFGDKFGAINALFSGLAFAGIIFTIFLQKRELTLQRRELENTRAEFISQNDTLRRQRFENTLFHLINLHQEIINNIDFDSSIDLEFYDKEEDGEPRVSKGRDCFRELFYVLIKKYRNWEEDEKKTPTARTTFVHELERDLIFNAFGQFYTEHEVDIGHYFRNLEACIKLIDSTDFIEKEFYIELVRAQMSTYEIILLFYLCLWLEDSDMRKLVEKYHFLRDINIQHLITMQHIELINEEAYKS